MNEEGNPIKGIVIGLGLSIAMWAIIIYAIIRAVT